MVRKTLLAAAAAAALAAPVQAQDLGDIVTGVAQEYLRQEQDRATFAQAQQAGTLRAYQSYLQQFPQGIYAAEARQQIQRLGGRTTAAAPANPYGGGGVDLTRDQRLVVQRRLNALGYTTGGIDASFGPSTRRAIGLWQRDRGYTQTGVLNRAQANELLRGTAAAAPAAGTATAAQPAAATSVASAAQAEANLRLSRQQRLAIQAGLTRRGFDTRGVDGIFGRGTRGAIAGWQRANDAPATGYLTAAQAQRLSR